MSRTGVLALIVLLAGCPASDDDSDGTQPTDTETDVTGLTDATDVPIETDLVPTDSDTAPLPPTDTDTDLVIDTDTDLELEPCPIPGWVRDCNLECYGPGLSDDDFCDDGPAPQADFNCLRFEFDGGACTSDTDPVGACPSPGDVRDCNNSCVPGPLLGDDFCDDGPAPNADFDCALFNFDEGDCLDTDLDTDTTDLPGVPGLACPDPLEITDCSGTCYRRTWIGDDICDDGSTPGPFGNPDFDCDHFGADGGDCLHTDTDVVVPTDTDVVVPTDTELLGGTDSPVLPTDSDTDL